jgi:class 3 adenylate cyclase
MSLPTGTLTFLFTDIEGSSQLWEIHSESMQPAVIRHNKLLRATVRQHDGQVVK